MFGAVAPLAAWGILARLRRGTYLLHLFSAFCLLASVLTFGVPSRLIGAGTMIYLSKKPGVRRKTCCASTRRRCCKRR
jgi:hypothetical protein